MQPALHDFRVDLDLGATDESTVKGLKQFLCERQFPLSLRRHYTDAR